MRDHQRWLVPAFLAASFATLVVPTGIILWRRAFEPLPTEGLRMLRLVHNQVVEQHVETQDPEALLEHAIAGMVSELDPFSRFIAPGDVSEFEGRELEGTYVGIGVQFFGGTLPMRVKTPLLGGPALEAGLLPGDVLLRIDDWNLPDGTPDDVLRAAEERLRGPAGTAAKLLVRRGDTDPFEITLRRGVVPTPKVKWAHLVDAEARFGYVYVEGFQRHMAEAFDAAIATLEAEAGGPLHGLILDLRQDPGGLLDEAVALSNRFLASGEIVSLKRRDEVVVEHHDASPERCTLPDLPLVVLIDGGTASASEVVAGALQDHGRARVVGVRSFGKGVVQSIYTWPGEDFRLRLTTSHYYTPNGRNIERRLRRAEDGTAPGGLDPDVILQLDEATARRIERRLGALEVPRRFLADARTAATSVGTEIVGPLTTDEDPQLAAALAELRALANDHR